MSHRIIIHGTVDNLILAARAAAKVLAPDYQWPADGVTVIGYRDEAGDYVATFGIKRNKSSITLWEQA